MLLRSMLFVPGDSERKIEKSDSSPADALIYDLEDSVAPDRTSIARGMICEHLKSRPDRSSRQLWVRINPLDTDKALPDLAGIMAGAPDGIVLPKIETGAEITQACHYLSALEAREGLELGSTKILAVATETPRTLFTMDSYRGSSPRLAGLTWGAEDLSAALGAITNKGGDGKLEFTYQMARSLCLAAAVSAGVQPLDAVHQDFRDDEGLAEESRLARRAGFTGKVAIHPAQVEIINNAFTPDQEEIDFAKRVVDVFAANPDKGTIGMDGLMLDMPHLKQARRVLEMAALASQRKK